MDELVGTFFDEWKTVVEDQERQKQFRQFANTVRLPLYLSEVFLLLAAQDERVPSIEPIVQRGQPRPANWAKSNPEVLLKQSDISTPKSSLARR